MWRDLRYAAQGLARSPGFTAAAVLALGLATGANAAMFGLVDALWFRPPGIADPDALVRVFATTAASNEAPWSYPEYLELRDASTTLDALVARGRRGAVVRGAAGASELALVNVVSLDFFSALGIRPHAGRLFAPGDEARLDAEPGIVLGHAYWQRRYGADPSIVGRTIPIGGRDPLGAVVLGVLPSTFRDLDAAADRDLWMPPQTWSRLAGAAEFQDRGSRWFDLIGLRRAGSTTGMVQAEIATLAAAMSQKEAAGLERRSTRVVDDLAYRWERGGVNAAALLGLVLLVVLITCVNVANLLLARHAARGREMAVRVALGASRWRIARGLFAESALLGILGAGAGILTGAWLIRLIPAVLLDPPGFRAFTVFQMDARVLAFTLAVTALTTVLFGMAPGWTATRRDSAHVLRAGAGSAGGARDGRSLRSLLVVGQVAVSVVLLCVAGVLARSFIETRRADLGFSRAPLLTAWVSGATISKPLFEQAAARLAALPGVERVAAGIRAPLSLSGGGMAQTVQLAGAAPGLEAVSVKFNAITPDFFDTFGTRLRAGRAFTAADEREGPAVLIVNEQFASRFFPGGGALDREVRVGAAGEPHRIIGVVQNAVINDIAERAEPYMYLPYWRGTYGEITFVLGVAGDPSGLAPAVRAALVGLDARLEPRRVLPMADYIEYSGSPYRATALLAGSLGVLGLILTALGVYGVIAYRTLRRTPEIGIRMALGASRAHILALVLSESAAVAGAGLAIGVPVALGATRLLSTLLFGVSPSDLTAFTAGAAAIAAAVLAASLLPARRAVRLSPARALRDG